MRPHRKSLLLLITIIALAGFFRFFHLSNLPPGLYPDEAMNGNNALEAIAKKDFKVFYPENNGREGLFINIQALALTLFHKNEPWVLRCVSVVFGTMTVLGVYFLARELLRKRVSTLDSSKNTYSNSFFSELHSHYAIALLSALFTATSFWHINFSRIGFRAIMAPFFLTWAIFFLLKSLRDEARGRSGFMYAIFGGIFFGGGFHSYIAYRATPLLIFLVLILFIKEIGWQKVLRVAFLYALVSIIVASPLLLYFLHNPQDFFGRTTQISIFTSTTPLKDLGSNVLKTILMFNVRGDENWRHNISGTPLVPGITGVFLLLGLVYAIKRVISKKLPEENNDRRSVLILFSWVVIAALPVVVSNEGIPHALRSILLIPPVMILIGWGAFIFLKTIRLVFPQGKKITGLFLTGMIIIVTLQSYRDYFVTWGGNPETSGAFNENYVTIGKKINALPREVPKYVVVEAGGVLVRNIPMPAETVMFITDSFRKEERVKKNIFYVLPNESIAIPSDAKIFTVN